MVAVWPMYWKGTEAFEKAMVLRKQWEIKRVTNLCYSPLSPSPGWPIQRWPIIFSWPEILEFDKDTERWEMIVAELSCAVSQAEGLSPTYWGPQSRCRSSSPWSMVIQFSLQPGSLPNSFSYTAFHSPPPPHLLFSPETSQSSFLLFAIKTKQKQPPKLMEALKLVSSSEEG